MTTEEAIKHLKEARLYPVAYSEEEQEAYDMAFDALRCKDAPTKLDRIRWDGCGWCRRFQGKFDETKADRYCKLCGRPLTEEAWAELERRINNGTVNMDMPC